MVSEGKCLARVNNQVIFIDGAAPGDVADLRITRQKKNYAEAQATAIKVASPQRVTPFCEHFGMCGGCKWQHLAYESQLQFKHKQVEDVLRRIGKVTLPAFSYILASPATSYYRNKLEYTFSAFRWLTPEEITSEQELDRLALGFHIPGRFDKVFDVRNCYLQPHPSNAIRLAVNAWARANGLTYFDLVKQTGFLRNLLIRTSSSGQVMVVLQVAEDRLPDTTALLDHVAEQFPEITSLQYVLNQKRNETFHDLEVVCYKGLPYITEQMEDLLFRVGAKSFFQPDPAQALRLYETARSFAGLTGTELVYDLYTGAGTIACFVARHCKEVIGIEYVESAITDARLNAADNKISNTRFYAGDLAKVLTDELLEKHGRPDVVITDPPRAGMHEDVVDQLLKAEPRKIVYVSCNPATQARDIQLLSEKFEVTKVQPVDMFPQTHHVENVVLLELKSALTHA